MLIAIKLKKIIIEPADNVLQALAIALSESVIVLNSIQTCVNECRNITGFEILLEKMNSSFGAHDISKKE